MRQFTATTYILDADKVLLLLHPKLGKWLPPGGHVEKNETPPECAKREVKEETGLEVEFIREEHLWMDHSNAKSIERPFLCLLENIPEHGSHPAHQHIDFIYLGRPISGRITEEHQALQPIRWFSLKEILELEPEIEIFKETQETLQKIFELKPLDWHAAV